MRARAVGHPDHINFQVRGRLPACLHQVEGAFGPDAQVPASFLDDSAANSVWDVPNSPFTISDMLGCVGVHGRVAVGYSVGDGRLQLEAAEAAADWLGRMLGWHAHICVLGDTETEAKAQLADALAAAGPVASVPLRFPPGSAIAGHEECVPRPYFV